MKTCGHDGAAIELSDIRVCPACAKLPEYARRVANVRRRVGLILDVPSAKRKLAIVDEEMDNGRRDRAVAVAERITQSALEELDIGNLRIARELAAIAIEARRIAAI